MKIMRLYRSSDGQLGLLTDMDAGQEAAPGKTGGWG